jgi:hypothetical protein
MSKIKLIIFISIFRFSIGAQAQFNETIRTGRPGQSIGAFTVGKNILQLQQGLEYNVAKYASYSNSSYITNNVVRFGLLENFEISALVDYRSDKNKDSSFSKSLNGLSNLHLGFRFHIKQQKGWIPSMGFQMRLRIPNISNNFGTKNLAPVMVFIANWSLPKKFSLATNWILSYNGFDAYPTGRYVCNVGYQINPKWSCFIENYGQYHIKDFMTRYDGGFAYRLSNNVQLDLSGGYGKNKDLEDYFISAGISWRVVSMRK